jgi:hypothetical protein
MTERIEAYAYAAAAGALWAVVPAEVFSGVLAPTSVPTVAAAVAATAKAVAAGAALQRCLEHAGRTADAAVVGQYFETLAHENHAMESVLEGASANA